MSRKRNTTFPNTVIRASAGTGKTFQLSNRFIALLAAGEPVDQILAVTFARKAAGEITDRILVRLAEAALDEDKRAELAGHIGEPSLDRNRCLQLLEQLVSRLHRLRVGTLDSFFAQLAGSFSLELGLPPGWTIIDELDDRRLRDEAIRAVLQGESTAGLHTLLNLLSKGEVGRSVTDEIREVVDGLYDLYCETDEAAWRKLPREKPLSDDELQAAVDRIAGLSFSDKRFGRSRDADVESARTEDWETFVRKGLAAKIAGGVKEFYKKPIGSEVVEAYGPLLGHARAVLLGQLANQTEATRQLLDKFDAAFQRMKTQRRGLRFEDVTRSLLRGLSQERIANENVGWRLDARLRHLLLDEFQDTSLAQWNVMRPFAEQAARGGGRSFFCVGDVKQAIYRWRGGLAEIFDAVSRQLEGVAEQSLTKSYRSAQPVIDTVNRVFGTIATNRALDDYPAVAKLWGDRFQPHSTAKGALPGYCSLMTASRAPDGREQPEETLVFAAAKIAEIHRQNPGRSVGVLVRRNASVARLIYELRTNHEVRASEEGGNPLTDSAAVQLVLSLLRIADHPGHTAARFHVAHSSLGKAVALQRHDDDAAALRASLAVREALLRDGYGPTIYGWAAVLAGDCDQRELSRLLQLVELAYQYEDAATCRADDFIRVVEGRRVEDPTAADVRVMTFHQAKGLQFDMVVLPELDVDLKGRPPKVVVGRDDPVAPVNRVCRYANEHVQQLLPPRFQRMFADWADQAVGESLCLLYVAMTRAAQALVMVIAPARTNERTLPKKLSGLLRAALTDGRPPDAERLLFEHGDPRPFQTGPKYLAPGEYTGGRRGMTKGRSDSRRQPVYDSGQHDTDAPRPHRPPVSSPGAQYDSARVHLRESPALRRRGLDRQSPSGQQGGTFVDLKRRLRLGQSTAMTRGSLFHEWFEQVEWLDDGEPDEAALERVAGRFAGSELNVAAELEQFRRMLRQPAIRAALSRSSYGEPDKLGLPDAICRLLRRSSTSLQLRNECPFALREQGALWQGAVDRLVVINPTGLVPVEPMTLHDPRCSAQSFSHRDKPGGECFPNDGGRPLAADIIDFKTDAVAAGDEGDVDTKVEEYRPQLEAYRGAVSRLLGLEPAAISARLLFVATGEVRTCNPSTG